MQALYLENGRLDFRVDYPLPQLAAGEALIHVNLCGICSTDLELVKGYGGFQGVPGHEFAGVVEATADSADSNWIGRRVVGTINLGCRNCPICIGQGSEHCPHRTVLGILNRDGVFAEHVALPVANLLPIPDEISDETAVFTEPLAAALRIREQLVISPTARIAVIGPGRLGMLVGQVLVLAGSSVIMLGRNPDSLALPARLGLATGLVADAPSKAFDIVVEVTGNEAGMAESLRLVRPLGTLVLKSTFHGRAQIDLSALVVDEITVVGSRCGPFAPALRLLTQGAIEVLAMIDADFSLRDGEEAFEVAGRPGVRKVLLRP